MKQIQKRYIYSALFASVFFIVSYAVLKINIIISILLTAVIYIGGIFLFKKEDIRELNSEDINNYYYYASKIANEANRTNNKQIIKNVNEITVLTDNIIVSLSQRPKKVEQAFSFFDYYLDVAYKILYKYNYLKETKKEDKIIDNIDSYIENILDAFKKQYKNMQESKIIDMDNEIKMFEQINHINKNDIKVGDINE